MKIQIEIAHSDGKDKLVLVDPSDAVQQFAIAKFFGYCRDANGPATLSAQNRKAGGNG